MKNYRERKSLKTKQWRRCSEYAICDELLNRHTLSCKLPTLWLTIQGETANYFFFFFCHLSLFSQKRFYFFKVKKSENFPRPPRLRFNYFFFFFFFQIFLIGPGEKKILVEFTSMNKLSEEAPAGMPPSVRRKKKQDSRRDLSIPFSALFLQYCFSFCAKWILDLRGFLLCAKWFLVLRRDFSLCAK